jgi:hypothetical protein
MGCFIFTPDCPHPARTVTGNSGAGPTLRCAASGVVVAREQLEPRARRLVNARWKIARNGAIISVGNRDRRAAIAVAKSANCLYIRGIPDLACLAVSS